MSKDQTPKLPAAANAADSGSDTNSSLPVSLAAGTADTADLADPASPGDTAPESGSELEYWENHLASWQQSGLSQREYCVRHGLNYNAFSRWKTKFARYYKPKSSIKLVEVKRDFNLEIEAPSSHGGRGYGFGHFGPPSSPPHSNPKGSGKAKDSCDFGIGPGFKRHPSGIGFWYGEFYIEVDVRFCSESLTQLLGTLQNHRIQLQMRSGIQHDEPSNGE